MGKCKSCGKHLAILGGRQKVYYYGCSYRHTRGETVCSNNHRARMEWLDAAVIESIRRQLSPEQIAYTVEKMAQLVERERKGNKDKPRQLQAEARELQTKLDRFMRAIADGEEPKTILGEIKRLETRLEAIKGELQALSESLPVWTPAQIRDKCGERLRRFEELLLGDVPLARQALRRLLIEPLRIAPVTVQGRRTLRFEGATTLGPLLDPSYKGWASPRGFEPRLPP
jgi:ssDNA-binding Zn-finger/Zn-ribbon topoisomerase 1